MRFYVTGCDAELSVWEFVAAVVLGVSVVAAPLLIKVLLGVVL